MSSKKVEKETKGVKRKEIKQKVDSRGKEKRALKGRYKSMYGRAKVLRF